MDGSFYTVGGNYDLLREVDLYSNEEVTSFELSQITKPQFAIDRIIERLCHHVDKVVLSPGDTYVLSQSNKKSGIVLLASGAARFYAKKINSTENAMLFGVAFSPNILGLIGGYSDFYGVKYTPFHYIEAETSCVAYVLSAEEFAGLVDKYELWHDVSRILAYRLLVLIARKVELEGCDAYKKIRSLLFELWAYPHEVREGINVFTFIRSRTLISRSQILKILSELRSGNYIEMNKGRLSSLNRLPRSY